MTDEKKIGNVVECSWRSGGYLQVTGKFDPSRGDYCWNESGRPATRIVYLSTTRRVIGTACDCHADPCHWDRLRDAAYRESDSTFSASDIRLADLFCDKCKSVLLLDYYRGAKCFECARLPADPPGNLLRTAYWKQGTGPSIPLKINEDGTFSQEALDAVEAEKKRALEAALETFQRGDPGMEVLHLNGLPWLATGQKIDTEVTNLTELSQRPDLPAPLQQAILSLAQRTDLPLDIWTTPVRPLCHLYSLHTHFRELWQEIVLFTDTKENPTMTEKQDPKFLNMKDIVVGEVKEEATQIGLRLVGNQFVRDAQATTIPLVCKVLDPTGKDRALRRRVKNFLLSPAGEAALGALSSIALDAATPLGMANFRHAMARELRVRSGEKALDPIVEIFIGPLRNAFASYISMVNPVIADVEAESGVRVATGEQTEKLEEHDEQAKEPATVVVDRKSNGLVS